MKHTKKKKKNIQTGLFNKTKNSIRNKKSKKKHFDMSWVLRSVGPVVVVAFETYTFSGIEGKTYERVGLKWRLPTAFFICASASEICFFVIIFNSSLISLLVVPFSSLSSSHSHHTTQHTHTWRKNYSEIFEWKCVPFWLRPIHTQHTRKIWK